MTQAPNALTKFVNDWIVELDRSYNIASEVKPIHLSYVEYFEQNGWTSQDVPNQPKHHRMFTPDGYEYVTVKGVSASKHPAATTRICRSKQYTKLFLDRNGVPNPTGASFDPNELRVATEYFNVMPKPVVVKPSNSSSSHGVTVGVNSVDELRSAWEEALEGGNERTKVIIEQQVSGLEVRVYVIGDQVVASVVRVPPFVVGDGASTIGQLLEIDRERRRCNKKIRATYEPHWDYVRAGGFYEESVPNVNEIVFMSPFSTTYNGALFYDVTDELSESISQAAVAAKDSIPYLEIAGIDILIDDVVNPQEINVIEVNTTSATDLHRFPAYGKNRPVEKYVADYYHNQVSEK